MGRSRELRESQESDRESMARGVEARIAGNVSKIEGRGGRGDEVIPIVESMEMKVPVEAPGSGRLAELRAVEGDADEEGAIPAVIE